MCVLAGSVLVHRTAFLTFDQSLLHELTLDAKCGFLCCIPIATEMCAFGNPFHHGVLSDARLDRIVGLVFYEHHLIRSCLDGSQAPTRSLGCRTFFMGMGSSALLPNRKAFIASSE
ncbi:hypothetical protein BT93_G2053 [Corymbia citriodora subsp. variegata]|nr:hypothetical protein BT93_G2053 [Corymbia citriodora subsp. variegata]